MNIHIFFISIESLCGSVEAAILENKPHAPSEWQLQQLISDFTCVSTLYTIRGVTEHFL